MLRSGAIMAILISLVFIMAACNKLVPQGPADDTILDGPLEGLSAAQLRQHLDGDIAFNDEIFTGTSGLGPVFVATSCGSCHPGDGKGSPFTTLTRFGQNDSTGNHYLAWGGPQLQDRAIPGHQPEQIPAGATFSKFTPPANTGLGFIELVSDADIIAMANANVNNPDGVRGHPNWGHLPPFITPEANAIEQNGNYLCRFGKKGAAYNLLHQTVNAYNQDIGITSVFNTLDPYSMKDIDPEVSTQTIHNVVFYLQTLKAPIQRKQNDPVVQAGKTIFKQTGCESCHKESLQTGYSPVQALSYQTFHPYTDLLMHDMGAGLDDGYTEGTAKTSEWRTPALWGLGLAPKSQGGQYFLLHDGRAHSIDEAIRLHGGEAEIIKNRYTQLSQGDKDALMKFLQSL